VTTILGLEKPSVLRAMPRLIQIVRVLSLLRAGSRNGVHNPGEFFLLTRTFVIMESLLHQLAPHHDYMASFREEISRLSAQHFSRDQAMRKTTTLARELERLMSDAPGDARRTLRRLAKGNLGRLQARPWRRWATGSPTISISSIARSCSRRLSSAARCW